MPFLSFIPRTRGLPIIMRLMIAGGLTLVAFGVRTFVLASLGTIIPYLTYYPAVLLSTVMGGPVAGVVSALLSAVLTDLFITGLADQAGLLGNLEFLGVAALMIGIVELAIRSERERTQRKAGEARETQLSRLIEQAPVSIAMFDRDMVYIAASDRWLKSLGLDKSSTLGRRHYDLFPNLPEHWKAAHRRGLSGETVSGEFDFFDQHDGSGQYFSWQVQPWQGDKGQTSGIIIIGEDLTQRIKDERTLQRSEQRLRLAIDAANMAIWDWDIASGHIIWNEQYFRFLGYETGSIKASYEAWASRVVPEDLVMIEPKLQQAIEQGTRYSAQFRVRSTHDQIRWMEAYGQVTRLEDGRPERFYGVMLDVTERKNFEEAQRQKLVEIEALYDNAPLGLVLLDKDLRYLRINRTLAQINGAPVDAHIHKTLREMVPQLAPMVETRIREAMTLARVVEYETVAETTGCPGELKTWKELIYPLKDSDGHVDKVGMIVEDITARKKAESHTRLLLSEVNHRAKNLLAVVQAVAEASANEGDARTFVADFKSRIAGLAASHDLLVRSQWHGVELTELIQSQLRFFDTSENGRILLEGPLVHINASTAQTLGMTVHELATNAVKYGALSSPQGRIRIEWSVDLPTARFRLSWTETGGPAPVAPTSVGFGTAVLTADLEHALDADVTLSYPPTGLSYSLSAPLDVVQENGQDSEGLHAPAHH